MIEKVIFAQYRVEVNYDFSLLKLGKFQVFF